MKKNVASQSVGCQMVSATDGSAFTSAVTVYVTGNAGTQAIGSVGSGACTHEGNGFHTYAPAQAETNYDHVAFTFIGTGAVPATVQVYTGFPQSQDHASAIDTIDNFLDTEIADIQARLPAALVSGRMSSDVVAISGDTAAADSLEAHFDDTAGAYPLYGIVDRGTAQSATSTTLVLRSAASFADDALIGATIVITGGSTGVGESRRITDYVGSTDTATVEAWTVTPTGTITYVIYGTAADSGSSGLDAAGVRAAIGLASANLDTQLSTIDTVVDRIEVDTQDLQSRTPAALVSGRMDASVGAMAANTMTASALATDAVAEIADGVWDEAIAGHATAGSTGEALSDAGSLGTPLDAAGVRAAIGMASANLDTQLSTIDTVVDAVKAKTDNLPTDPADASVVAGLIAATEAKVDTVDTVVDAIKAKTDSLTFGTANVVDAHIKYVAGEQVTGSGTAGDPWGPV